MDLSIPLDSARSARSARSAVRINPITGEEMPFSSRVPKDPAATRVGQGGQCDTQRSNVSTTTDIFSHRQDYRPNSRPDDVPPLNLIPVCGREDEADFTLHMDQYKLKSPGPQSNRSSRPEQKQVAGQVKKPGINGTNAQKSKAQTKKQASAWDKQPVPEDLPPPSEHHKQQYSQIQNDMKKEYQMKGQDVDEQASITERVEQLKLKIPQFSERETDGETAQQEREWTAQKPYQGAAGLKKADKDYLEEEKRKFKLVETVLIDQLSRPVISDPEQNTVYSQARGQSHRPGQKRGSVRTMHHSKISTSGSSTENLLSRRVQFGARILTRCGRDAIRELSGFYFAVDNSLTIYEFRQFGKTAKALPFVKRGVYRHIRGRRSGEVISLSDIRQGNTLLFSAMDQPVPDSVKSDEMLMLRVTSVEDTAKASIMLDGVSPSDRDDVWRRAHLPHDKDDFNDKLLLRQIQTVVHEQIKKRGIKVWMGIGHQFRKSVDNSKGLLNKYELEKALVDFHIKLPQQKIDDLWEMLDCEATSFLPYDEFMRAFLGEMPENRKILVRKAFCKIDAGKQGAVTVDSMRKFYNANKHPKVKSGQCSERDVLNLFMASFQSTQTQGLVIYAEFEEYYEGLSASIDNDEDFSNVMSNAWSI